MEFGRPLNQKPAIGSEVLVGKKSVYFTPCQLAGLISSASYSTFISFKSSSDSTPPRPTYILFSVVERYCWFHGRDITPVKASQPGFSATLKVSSGRVMKFSKLFLPSVNASSNSDCALSGCTSDRRIA